MSNIIMDEKGFINKYEWDAIMALWWVFWVNNNESYRACLSALKQQESLKELNKQWEKRWFSEIKARIWIHFWNAIIWNIWSEWRKMEFTALWDSVNLASRLEWVNKFYWTYICVSEDIYKKEKTNFEFRYLDKIRVQWKEKAIKIYELLWIKWEVEKDILIRKRSFEKAIKLYLARDFILAKEIFIKLIKEGDNAGRIYLDMCEIYIKTPPSKDWDGVSTMTSK
jgi:adenylate cyclase